jgi:hypothetical protein
MRIDRIPDILIRTRKQIGTHPPAGIIHKI